MKKTPFIWFVIVLGILDILFAIPGIASQFKGPFGGLDVVDIVINIVDFIISVIYIYMLFKMKGNLLKWTNYSFGLSALSVIFPVVITPVAWPLYLEMLALIVILWFFFYRHLRKISPMS